MPIQVQGNSGGIIEVDGSTYRAVIVTVRPADYGLIGQYCISMQSGTMAAGLAAFATVFQARWTDAIRLALVWGVSIDGMSGGTASFTAGIGYFGLQIARSWTVDGSGGTTAPLTGNDQSLRSTMAPSLMGAIRISSTAALTAGTLTVDTQGVGQAYFAVPTTASFNFLPQYCMYGSASMEDGGNSAPIVLAQNEGVSLVASVPASGTWKFGVTMSWSEVNSY